MITDHLFIIFCGHGPNALGVIRSLHEACIKPIMIIDRDGPHNYADKSKYVGAKYYADTSLDALELLIDRFGQEAHKPFVYTTDDFHAQLLDENYERLDGHFFFFNCGAQGKLTEYLNKEKQCQIAEECGFCVPNREVVTKGDLPTTLHYPIITKTITSNEGGWKRDVYVCDNEKELKEAYDRIEANSLILEEYVNRIVEQAYQGIAYNKGNKAVVPLISLDKSFGKSSFGDFVYYHSSPNELMVEKLFRFLKQIQYEGIFEIETMVDNEGKEFFLEINLRDSAKNYAVTYGGFNMPYQWAYATLHGECETFQIAGGFWAMKEFDDFYSRVLSKRIGLFKWLTDVRKTKVFFWHYRNDNAPVRDFYVQKIKRLFHK